MVRIVKVLIDLNKLRQALQSTDDIGEFVLDLTCDVWGGAGPDCRTRPV